MAKNERHLLIEVGLDSGINAYDLPVKRFQGGPSVGLYLAKNSMWQPRHQSSEIAVRQGLAFPIMPIEGDTFTFTSNTPTHIFGYIPFPTLQRRNLLVARDATNAMQVWRIDTGAPTAQTILGATPFISETFTGAFNYPAVSVWWRTQNLNVEARDLDGNGSTDHTAVTTSQNGLVFFTHPGSSHILYIDNNGSANSSAGTTNPGTPDMTKWYIRSYTDTNSDTDLSRRMDYGSNNFGSGRAAPPGASALAIHLDRLWMAAPSDNPTRYGRHTLVWYTDPSNWRMIRPENFITIEDRVVAMATPTSGGIGVGGQSQLLLFGVDTISVLDGDPTQGNTFLRVLANNIGVLNQKSVVETPYGVVIVATDGQIYLIPPGAQRVIPIGDPIISRIRNTSAAEIVTEDLVTPIQLFWHSPYVYLMVGNLHEIYAFDMSSPDNPIWWGPIVGASNEDVFVTTVPNGNDSSILNSSYFFSRVPTTDTITKYYINQAQTDFSFDIVDYDHYIQTGLIQFPGYRVELKGVYVVRTRAETPSTLTITATTAERQTYTAVKYGHNSPTRINTPAAAIDTRIQQVEKYIFVGIPTTEGNPTPATGNPVSDSFNVTITGTTSEEMLVQRVFLAVKVQPYPW